jgi:deoxyribonuclease IV
MNSSPFRLGVHVPIAGGIEKAVLCARELGCSAMQIFSRNPRGWRASPLDPQAVRGFRREIGKGGIEPVAVHTLYLLNLASEDRTLHERSVQTLKEDLGRAAVLGALSVVTHLGSGKQGSPGSGRRRAIEALKQVMEAEYPVALLLENSAGGGGMLGASLEEIAEIIDKAGDSPRLGFCFDSCHGFAAGYDFRSEEQSGALLRKIDATVGLDRLKLLHLNDSAGTLGSRLDRHEHIGKGQIGLEGFRSLLGQKLFREVPMILETPKREPRDDVENLSRIRRILGVPRGEAPKGTRADRL